MPPGAEGVGRVPPFTWLVDGVSVVTLRPAAKACGRNRPRLRQALGSTPGVHATAVVRVE